MFSARKFNQTVILYFITVILGLLFSALTSCSSATAQPVNEPVQGARIEAAQPQATQTQCQAKTKAGTQCSRQAAEGESYCWQHGGKTKAESAGTAVQTTGTCGATTKAGTACKNRTKDGGKCHLHKG